MKKKLRELYNEFFWYRVETLFSVYSKKKTFFYIGLMMLKFRSRIVKFVSLNNSKK